MFKVVKNQVPNLPTVKEALDGLKAAFNNVILAENKMKEKLKEFGLLL